MLSQSGPWPAVPLRAAARFRIQGIFLSPIKCATIPSIELLRFSMSNLKQTTFCSLYARIMCFGLGTAFTIRLLRMLQADVQFSKSQMLLMDVFFAQLFHQQKQERANSESGFSLSDSPQETSKDQKADSALLAGQDGLFVIFLLWPAVVTRHVMQPLCSRALFPWCLALVV